MEPDAGSGGERISRRRMLCWIGVAALGTGVVIGTAGLPRFGASRQTSGSKQATTRAVSAPVAAVSAQTVIAQASQPTKVKVKYFQMTTLVSESTERYVLPTPAHYSDLLGVVLTQHPSLAPMLPSMMVLVEGVSAQPGSILRDGDEVDFIPAIPGG